MNILKLLSTELEEEYLITKDFFKLYPENKDDYAPHPKCMKMKNLVMHILDIFRWPDLILHSDNLDFVKDNYKADKFNSREELLTLLDQKYQAGKEAIATAEEEDLALNWSILNDGQKIMEWNKYGAIRHALNQITHHRAQLGLYYRLNEIQLPGSYGPSADTM